MSVQFAIKCAICFSDLDGEVRQYNYDYTIFASPCSHCLKDAEDAGAMSAEQALFQDGFNECERQYKEDIRAAVKLTQDVCAESKDGETKALDSSL